MENINTNITGARPALLALVSLFASTALADTLIDNTSEPSRATTEITPSFWAAQSFYTDASSYTLQSIETVLGDLVEGTIVVATLHADLGSSIGAQIASLNLVVPAGLPSLVALTPAGDVPLSPETPYWLVIGVVSAEGAVGWDYAEGNAASGAGSFGAYGYSEDGGVSWTSFGTDDPYKVRINVTPVVSPDSDSDGVPDDLDNCTAVPNPDQRDTNGDGFGNLCDADLNNDCFVNFIDVGAMKAVFFGGDADADLNGDGFVNFPDLGILKSVFFLPPGPSGVPNICPVQRRD